MPRVANQRIHRPRYSKFIGLFSALLIISILALFIVKSNKDSQQPGQGVAKNTINLMSGAVATENLLGNVALEGPSNCTTSNAITVDTGTEAEHFSPNKSQNMPLNVVNRRPRRSSGFNGGSAEQVIAMLVKANSMDAMPPIPMISEDKMLYDFINAVTNDIVIYDDDEQTIKFKENVASLKNEFARFIDEGGSITNAIMQYQEWIKECQSIRQVVIAEYKRLKNEVSQEEADAYLVKANKELENDGIPTVNLGSERKRNRAHRDAREAAALKTIEEPNQTKQ